MPVNLDKPHLWKQDIAQSVDMYNTWFMLHAPRAFRNSRAKATQDVEATLRRTDNMTNISAATLRQHPQVLPSLRMSTCPPIAVDRLIGLAGVARNLVICMDRRCTLPPRMPPAAMERDLAKISDVIRRMADPDIYVWLGRQQPPTDEEVHRAASIVADRLCGAVANPIIRNAQERRQLAAIRAWLENRGYAEVCSTTTPRFDQLPAGTFAFRLNVPAMHEDGMRQINIPVDATIMPKIARRGDLPVLLEAKSAGDYTNTNKRRKEEATKMSQLRNTHGDGVRFCLFLCGYFDSSYLGYEAAEGIDWVWEHRIDDLALFGL